MKNIIFLDIDGVLQPFDANEKDYYDLEELKLILIKNYSHIYDFSNINEDDIGDVYYNWDKFSIRFLEQLLIETKSKIVLSSGWRETFSLEELKALFSIHNLDSYIIDVIDSGDKKRNIFKYIKEHNVENYIVFDDLHMEKDFGGRFSLCNERLDLNNIIYAKNVLLNNFKVEMDDKEIFFYKDKNKSTFLYKNLKVDDDHNFLFIMNKNLGKFLTKEDSKYIFSEIIRIIAYNNPEILGIILKYSSDLSPLFNFDFIGDKKQVGLFFIMQYIDINYNGYKNINFFKNNFEALSIFFNKFYEE